MKIIHDEEKCIHCGTCAGLCPKHWEMGEDGKIKLLGSKINSQGNQEKEVEKIECNQEAAESCPVEAIEIIK